MTTDGTPCTVLCDLDGVVWLAHQPIPGSAQAVARLRQRGHRVLFVTNNSAPRREEHEAALRRIGIAADGEVLTSSMAAARLVTAGERVLVCGGDGISQALRERGIAEVSAGAVDAGGAVDVVMVGLHRTFDYRGLTRAAGAIRRGARLVGTNDDATYPTPEGPIPGGGAILAAVRAATGVEPVVAGKPHAAMADLVRATIGASAAQHAVMVGDRPDTDGLFARELGCRYAHVRSGVTPAGTVVTPVPDVECDDLAAVADLLLDR